MKNFANHCCFLRQVGFVCLILGTSISHAETELKLSHQATVKINGQTEKTYQPNDVIPLSGTENLLIEAKGRVPLLIVPSATKSELKLDLPLVEDWPSSKTQQVLDKKISELLSVVFLSQKYIQQKRFEEALKLIDMARLQYPAVQQLSVLRVSTLVLLGRREEAVDSLNAALSVDPTNAEMQELSRALKSNSAQRKEASQ